jgi:hypothetical protein
LPEDFGMVVNAVVVFADRLAEAGWGYAIAMETNIIATGRSAG